jgi:4-amino-4-deoxy-L-arabinose transferase-like glycosyltransferase
MPPQEAVARSPNSRASVRRVLFAVIAAGMLARFIVAFALGDRADPVSGAADQYSYDALAQRVVAGHGFTFPSAWYPFTEANEPTAHWSYLYTLYLAAVYALGGHHPLVARLLQVLLSGLSCWLTYRLGQRLFDEEVGLAAAALSAVYAYFVFFSAALMTQTYYITTLLAALVCAVNLARQPARRDWVLLGLSLGVGVVLRQTLLLFTPVLIGWVAWATRERVCRRDLLTAVGVIVLLILPWTVYNYHVFGDFLLLNSNGGFWLYSSNHPQQGTDFNPSYVAPLPAHLRGLPEPALDRALYRDALGFIAADPARFARLTLSRIPHYFWLLPSAQSSTISNLGRVFSFTLYLPFMLAGLFLSRHLWRACLPLYLYIAFDTTLHLTSWAAPRYRLPSDAVMMVFAGLAVVTLTERLRLVSRRKTEPSAAT